MNGAALTPWTTADVAAALGVSRSTVLREVRAGKIRHARVRGQLRFAPEWVEEYVRGVTSGGLTPPVVPPAT